MSNIPLDQMTLREMFTELERLMHELSEHIEQGFFTQLHELRKVTRTGADELVEISDLTVRHTAETVLKSEFFTSELYQKLQNYFTAIEHSVSQIVETPL